MKKTWCFDGTERQLIEMNGKLETGEIKAPKGSVYVFGSPKNDKGKIGIYFYDPTAKENE